MLRPRHILGRHVAHLAAGEFLGHGVAEYVTRSQRVGYRGPAGAIAEAPIGEISPIHEPQEAPKSCDGCESGAATGLYHVTHYDGSTALSRYCENCAELAAADWNGETAAIRPVAERVR